MAEAQQPLEEQVRRQKVVMVVQVPQQVSQVLLQLMLVVEAVVTMDQIMVQAVLVVVELVQEDLIQEVQ